MPARPAILSGRIISAPTNFGEFFIFGKKFLKFFEKTLAIIKNLWYYSIVAVRTGIEVVITGLTRNQFVGNGTWVRIPPRPPIF